MGKNLKGKELGMGLSQQKNGFYSARFTGRDGKRVQKRFKKLQDARAWIAEAQYQDEHGSPYAKDMTVDAWAQEWSRLRRAKLKPATIMSQEILYRKHIKPKIGGMLLKDVKQMHCQSILNDMSADYATGTISIAKTTMAGLFELALENDLIKKNPCGKTVSAKGRRPRAREALTKEEQKEFLEAIKGSPHEPAYRFALQTGMRAGEIAGLTWDRIDLDKMTVLVDRAAKSDINGQMALDEPKSAAGARSIPLTQEAKDALMDQKQRTARRKCRNLKWKDLVFPGLKKGLPIRTASFDHDLKAQCERHGAPYASMHILRHTFATRCAEAGMPPKVLQKILGHADIGITMNVYVSVDEAQKKEEMKKAMDRLAI